MQKACRRLPAGKIAAAGSFLEKTVSDNCAGT
jgi:hypothetical protein